MKPPFRPRRRRALPRIPDTTELAPVVTADNRETLIERFLRTRARAVVVADPKAKGAGA
jgi:hypothetical protein